MRRKGRNHSQDRHSLRYNAAAESERLESYANVHVYGGKTTPTDDPRGCIELKSIQRKGHSELMLLEQRRWSLRKLHHYEIKSVEYVVGGAKENVS
jgi:hypothetical protein